MADSQKYAETINVMPSAPAETKTQSNCTVVCDGQGRYTVTGINNTSEPIVFVFVLNEPFTIPKSVGNGGQGTMSLFNDAATNVNCSFFNGNSYIDGWMLSPVNRTHNSYTAQSDKVCDKLQIRIQENSSANVTFSPMFTNDGQYPSEFVPHQTWQHSLRKLTTATEAVENPLYSDGTAITAYTLKGNEEHTGTPSPQNPVMPNGVGEMSANLCNPTPYKAGYYINAEGQEVQNNVFDIYSISATANQSYTISANVTLGGNTVRIHAYTNGTWTEQVKAESSGDLPWSFTAPTGCDEIRISITHNAYEHIMVNTGTTALPYEPYGQYKIPILTNQATTNIYLGSTQTTRQIHKAVFDGTEDWDNQYGASLFMIQGVFNTAPFIVQYTALSTEYLYNPIQSGLNTGLTHGEFALQFSQGGGGNVFYNIAIKNTTYTTKEAFKAYLAQQYANGTPVTVWYVLQTATTAAVNEPLMKIGDYADTLSNATSIPTTQGANSITVDTTVQPSEFTATWTGWHDAEVKEKSENLFDKDNAERYEYGLGENNTVGFANHAAMFCFEAEPNTNYSAKVYGTANTLLRLYRSNNELVKPEQGQHIEYDSMVEQSSTQYPEVTINSGNCQYIWLQVSGSWYDTYGGDTIMLNTGSTALPYAPYWK